MQVEIKMDNAYTEPKLILMTASMTKEVQRILRKLSEDAQPVGVRQQTEPRCRLGIIHGNPPLIHDYQYIIQLMRLWHQDTKYIDICQ